MKNFIVLFCIILPFIFSCKSEIKNYSQTEEILLEKKISLKENLTFLSPIKSFSFLNNGNFVVITENNKIILYDQKGDQVKEIKNLGQGSLEVYNPSIVKSYKNKFYIWCQDLMKIVEYSSNGTPLNEFFGFNHAIRRFDIDEDYIYTYLGTTLGKPYIQIFKIKEEKIIKEFGLTENNQIFSNLNYCGGGLVSNKESLIYLPSHTLRAHFINKSQLEENKVVLLDEPEFKIENTEEDAELVINSDQVRAFEKSLNSPIVTGIFSLGNSYVIISEVGKMEIDGQNIDTKNRKLIYLKYNNKFDLVSRKLVEYSVNQSCKLISSYKDKIYRIIQEEGENEMVYSLQEIKID